MAPDPLIGNATTSPGVEDSSPSPPRADVDEEREHHLGIGCDHAETLETILSPDRGPFADWGERGAICIVSPSTGPTRTTYLVREVVEPTADDLRLKETAIGHELVFEPEYKRRARNRARDAYGTAGLLYVHSHPERAEGRFSPGDLSHDRAQLYQETKHLDDKDAPLLVAVAHDGGDPWQVWHYSFRRARTKAQQASDDFGPESVERTAITAIRVAGPTLDKRPTADSDRVDGPAGVRGRLNAAQQDSTIRLYGKDGQRRFAGLRVAIVGAGGGGSILSETLAQVGVGELVVIDFDRVKEGNANRHLGATQEDLDEERDKVEVCGRDAREAATCPDFEARPVVGSVFEDEWQEYDALEHVLDCDLVMNAADPDTVRSTMSRLAYAHAIPVIDGGSKLPSKDGVLTGYAKATSAAAAPGLPCLKCSGQWTDSGFETHRTGEDENVYFDDGREEDDGGDGVQEEDDNRDDEETVREPSSMPTNLIAMGMASKRFLAMIQGIAPEITVGKANFRFANWDLAWKRRGETRLESCGSKCNLPPVGIGDAADLKRGPDFKLREERQDELPSDLLPE